jgi:hypothetical protein
MEHSPTVCQKITLALLQPHKKLSVPQLIRETGVAGRELLPVLNMMIGRGHVVVDGSRAARKTFLKAGRVKEADKAEKETPRHGE